MGKETTEPIISFFSSGRLIQELNHTFIALVSKSPDAIHLNDFIPISCYNTLHKFIAKILANRLLSVIEGLISDNQCAFLTDRLISDCFLLSHELVRDFNKPIGSRACTKIDLKNAFDSINREFVYFITHCLEFPPVWINWIKECIQKPMFSVLINGSPVGYFGSSRGIRKDNPISPYIFVIIMEFWTVQMDLAIASGTLQPPKREMPVVVSHLIFEDDMLIFCKANKKSFNTINSLLDSLAMNNSLTINREKRKLFLSKVCKEREKLADLIQIPVGCFPVRHLGRPLSQN